MFFPRMSNSLRSRSAGLSIFCLTIFWHFDILLATFCHFDILPRRYFATSIFCVRYFAQYILSVDILLFDILRLRYFGISIFCFWYFAFDILRFVTLLYDILSGTRSNHTDAAERSLTKCWRRRQAACLGTHSLMFIAEPPLTRHLSNAQLGDLSNAPLV